MGKYRSSSLFLDLVSYVPVCSCKASKRGNNFVPIVCVSVTDWYLGCFIEKPQDRTFNISAGNYKVSDTSAQECTSACAFLNQSYAATEGELCFCTSGVYNIYGKASNESQCEVTCSVLPCSDTSYIRVYSTQDAIGELKVYGPQTGWLLQDVNFTTTLGKGKETEEIKAEFFFISALVTLL